MLKFILLIVTLISSVVLVTVTVITPDVENEGEGTMYVSISPIGRSADHYLITSYEIIDDNWIRLNEPNGKSMVINTHNYNVCIEKTKAVPEFQKTKSLLEQRLNGFDDFSAVPK